MARGLLQSGGPLEVPRLSTTVRTYVTSGDGLLSQQQQQQMLDPEQLLLQRKDALTALHQQRRSSSMEGIGVGATPLARKIIPHWDSAPVHIRTAYEAFLVAVKELVGGELPSADLHDAAMAAYDAIASRVALEKSAEEDMDADGAARGGGSKKRVQEMRDVLMKALGFVTHDGGCIQRCMDLVRELSAWHAATYPAGKAADDSDGAAAATAGKEEAGKRPEFGADLEFRSPDDLGAVVEDLLQGLLGLSAAEAAGAAFAGAETGAADGNVGAGEGGGGGGYLPSDNNWADDRGDGVAVDGVAAATSAAAAGAGKARGLRWLWQMCVAAARGAGALQLSADELALSIVKLLSSTQSGEEVAGELFNLIGDGGFDFIQELLQHRKALVDQSKSAMAKLRQEHDDAAAGVGSGGAGGLRGGQRHGAMVTVQTEMEKQLEKLRRKEDKRLARAAGRSGAVDGGGAGRGSGALGAGLSGVDSEVRWLSEVGGFLAVVEESENKGVVDQLIGTGESPVALRMLPAGTKRYVMKGYEEVCVPAPPKSQPPPDEVLVKISDMEPFAQRAFEGYKSLNRIQSRIYHRAFYSNENLLVCAPTGAGKTNIAMITVLHEIGQHFDGAGVLQKNQFKIVYVAPMKALAAEMTAAFGRRLQPLGLAVRELTGDMQLTKKEMEETQMIVTTPEKWDVITRKSSDGSLASLVRLLIIDEVHLLNDDRGPVIETLVARTLRQVETTQSMIRIVGLSATLPNYRQVAQFLRVSVDSGLFYFDSSYRPVPLSQQYIGVTERNFTARQNVMHEICYNKVLAAVRNGKQAMVFVHSRKDTVKTGRILVEMAQKEGQIGEFCDEAHPQYGLYKKETSKSRNRELGELFQSGFGIHHAGMLRSDRSLTEKMFSDGIVKVLVCTSTLAWGVNLPAHTVIIKGTQLYDAKAGGFRDVGMLDVMQIFGRAGRPQFDTSGEGIIITTHDKLAHYLRLMTHQLPIESQFVTMLKDNLNAEVVLGTVTNVREASAWLSYTYLYVRMQANPLAYGMTWQDVAMDPGLVERRRTLIVDAARALDNAKMMRFDERSGNMYVTELGRVASHFYLRYTSVETYNEMLKQHMNDSELLNVVAHSTEFENIVVREEEMVELTNLRRTCCPLEIKGGLEEKIGKINVLIQVYLSRGYLDAFSLVADSAYISASLGRIMRALFEICLRRGWCTTAALFLEYSKAVERRVWPHQHPLRQFDSVLSQEVLYKLEQRNLTLDRLCDMEEQEIASILRTPHAAKLVCQCLSNFPYLELDARISPITRTVLQVVLTLTPTFEWKDRFHGTQERWWIWVEDSENEHIYHSEYFILSKKMFLSGTSHRLSFTIPIFEPLPAQYYVRAVSDSWLASTSFHTISFRHLILPQRHPPHTELLNLRPLPVSALAAAEYEALYKFSHFNPIQTQAFHTLYHSDHNVLLGAPTGSGKTISAELAMLRLFRHHPGMKVIYIAPLKALVRERIEDWKKGLVPKLQKTMVELTGDVTPDARRLLSADIIITTPEKWDGITRNWHDRAYAQSVGLMVLDEIHLLGQDRGPVLEVIVSRMRYISAQTARPVRFLGLSTALANARDLGDWLGIESTGLYNFKPSVRPVPLEVHIQGHPGKFYCPRMNAMNKPLYAAICTHSPLKPTLVFVSSRRQTRLTALDLIQYTAADEKPRQFVHVSEEEMEAVVEEVSSAELKHTLRFGIGLHHAGLNEGDRSIVETLFAERKIQVLVCTSTLAWGVNLPAHLVVVKGTEYYDGRLKRYVDFPITDVLQMMGRAGRPQYDTEAKAVILVHEPKKSFYKKFLYEPFPVESSLHQQLHDHLNAEVASGSITNVQDAMDYLTWTFFFRRLLVNPSYYDLDDTSSDAVNAYLSDLIVRTLRDLESAGCLRLNDDDGSVDALTPGQVASQYYLHFTSVALFTANLKRDTGLEVLLHVLCGAAEFDELPVRHNEDNLNTSMAKLVRWKVDVRTADDPHTKTNLLLQAHFAGLEMPSTDYNTDLKSVLDQTIRVLQAIVDISANAGYLSTAVNTMRLMQMVLQGMWWDIDSPLHMLPYVAAALDPAFAAAGLRTLPALLACAPDRVRSLVEPVLAPQQRAEFLQAWGSLPRVSLNALLLPPAEGSKGGKRETAHAGVHGEEEEEEIVVQVDLHRRRPFNHKSLRAYTPNFPKMKDEGWWLTLSLAFNDGSSGGSSGGSSSKGAASLREPGPRDELLALKRVSFSDRLSVRLRAPVSSIAHAPRNARLVVHLISDCYLGLDASVTLPDDLERLVSSAAAARAHKKAIPGNSQIVFVDANGSAGADDDHDEFFDASE